MVLKFFVDYAHNGDSLTKLLNVVQEHQKRARPFLFRSNWKQGESRRKILELLNKHPEIQVILTADDPNREDPVTIAKEIS